MKYDPTKPSPSSYTGHAQTCPAYGNWQPPYEECDCGYDDLSLNKHTCNVGSRKDCPGCLKAADTVLPAVPPQEKEICICAAIVVENGEVIRGHRHMDCLRTAGERGLKQKPGGEHQGFVTSRNRYVDRRIAAALQRAAGIESADTEHPYLNDECYSEDLYVAVPVSPSPRTPELTKILDEFFDDGSPSGPDEWRQVNRAMVERLVDACLRLALREAQQQIKDGVSRG